MRILITGGAGFIGSNLADAFIDAGHDVAIVDDLSSGSADNVRHGARWYRVDVRTPELDAVFAEERPEVVCHHAAQVSVRRSVEAPQVDAEVNVLGSLNVIEGALAAGTRKVVFAGSGGTLYGVPESTPTREGHPQRPLSPYGVSKKAVGDYLHYYREIHGLEYTTLALANVYGPRQDPHGESGVVAIFANKLLAGDRPTIFGDGEQTRDYIYVDDVCDAFVRAADKAGGLVVNIGTGIETSVQHLFDAMARSTGFGEPARYASPRAGELRRSALDPGRAAIHLGWQPWTALDQGLQRTIEWFRGRAIA